MKYFKISILIMVLILVYTPMFSQTPDSLSNRNIEFITNQLENISSTTDQAVDYTDLLEEYAYYQINPVSVNGDNIHKLVDLLLINEIQYQNILNYRNEYGNIRSKQELLVVEGFSKMDVEKVLHFISFASEDKKNTYKIKEVFKHGRHQLISRYSQTLEKSVAYLIPKDSAYFLKGRVYLGGPQKIYTRYSYNFEKKAGLGFTLEKDAGEAFGSYSLSDSVKYLVSNKLKLIDFSSAHLYVSDIGILKKLIIGDYHLEFGQGLTLWSGLSFGKSSDATMLKKYGRGIVQNTSVNENRFMRGAALCFSYKQFTISGFYSTNNIDANITSTDTLENIEVTGILETGNHRTINELMNTKVMKVNSFGGNLSFKAKKFSIGYSIINSNFNLEFVPQSEIYKRFYFTGRKNLNMGFDFTYNTKNIKFFGELSVNENSSVAGIIGNNIFIGNRLVLSMLYRNYPKDYFNFYNNPVKESSYARNEEGFYIGLKILAAKNLIIDAYSDFFKFPFLKYGVSYPSKGAEYLIQINYNPLQNFGLYFRFKSEYKSENYQDDYAIMPASEIYEKHSFRAHLIFSPIKFIAFKSRYESVIYTKGNVNEHGFLLYQDVIISDANFPLSGNFRFAIFSTDGWDSRIYAYENDVLYAFSVPAYYDKGRRFYLNIKYKMNRSLSFWLRVSRIVFDDKNTIGSGADLIKANHKTEIKFQLKVSL